MKKVLWISRHNMTVPQKQSLVDKLGEVDIIKVDGTIPNVHTPFTAKVDDGDDYSFNPLKEIVSSYDVVAVVLPINMLQQLLPFMGNTPLIQAINKRVDSGQKNEAGETVYNFEFDKWQQILKVVVETTDFV